MTAVPRSRADWRHILRDRHIEHVVVLGANGAMGLGSGALFTSVVPRVTFLARTKAKAEEGLKAAVQAVRSNTVAQRVETRDYESGFDSAVRDADIVFEAVAEDFHVKRRIFARVDEIRRADSIVATVSSGLSIDALAAGHSQSFRRNFLGLHFFNPPNVIVGTELVAGSETESEVVEFVDAFATKKLGRVLVRTADTPGFAGNRIGFKLLNECAQLAGEHGPLLIDRLVGPYTGRSMAPLATIDLVGWDIHKAIVDNVFEKTRDEAHATLAMPDYMNALVAKGTLGRKSGGGFFQLREDKTPMVLDPAKGTYRPVSEVKLPDFGFIGPIATLHREGRYRDALKAFVEAPGEWAALARKVLAGYVSYSFHRVGEVTETIAGIDDILGFGFNWAPPSVLADLIGAKQMVAMIDEAKLPVPKVLADAAASATPRRFYTNPRGNIGRFFVAG